MYFRGVVVVGTHRWPRWVSTCSVTVMARLEFSLPPLCMEGTKLLYVTRGFMFEDYILNSGSRSTVLPRHSSIQALLQLMGDA
jgi:hypothetical protein